MNKFDWHSDVITKDTVVNKGYRNTQNVRRFFKEVCSPDFKFNREFMAWIKNGEPKTMGDVASRWLHEKRSI